MQKIIILIISLFAAASASAQYTTPTCQNGQVLQCNNYPSYQYDAAGNRTAKYNFCWCAAPPPSRLANHGVDSTQTSAAAIMYEIFNRLCWFEHHALLGHYVA